MAKAIDTSFNLAGRYGNVPFVRLFLGLWYGAPLQQHF